MDASMFTGTVDTGEMNKELRAERDYISGVLTNQHRRAIEEDYELGKKLKLINEDTQTFGHGALAMLVRALDIYESLLYALHSFAVAYDDTEVKELLSLNTKTGSPFPWTIFHVRLLCRLTRKDQRRAMQIKCAEQEWSIRELTRNVQSKLGGKRENNKPAGRPPATPKGLNGHLDLFTDMTKTWVDRFQRFGKSFIELASDEDQKITKDHRKKLERLQIDAQQMAEFASQLLTEVSSVLRKSSKVAAVEPNEAFVKTFASYDDPEFPAPKRRTLAVA